jgi:negative regulator of sigma-B (phosphoserine phosphatase)
MGSLMLQESTAPRLDWGVALQPQPGQVECGDAWIIEPIAEGFLVAVIDGLGHGAAAAQAAQLAVEAIKGSASQPLEVIVSACHQALLRSRGAAMSLARIDTEGESLTWLGVGNVEGLVLKPVAFSTSVWQSEALVARGGVVGYELPTLRPASLPFKPGSFLVFATDGVKSGFAAEMRSGLRAQPAADQILAVHRRGTDDALAMVIQLLRD